MVDLILEKSRGALNLTKNRLRLVVSLENWKFFSTDISCTPAASYFHYYEMPRSFLLDTSVFNLYLFHWLNWEISS